MKVIALMGKAGSGKSLSAKFIMEELFRMGYSNEDIYITSFAQPLKELTKDILKESKKVFTNKFKKEEIKNSKFWRLRYKDLDLPFNSFGGKTLNKFEVYKPTGREMFQKIGDFIRDLNPDYFADHLVDRIQPHVKVVIVTDVRFLNEYLKLKTLDTTFIRVRRIKNESNDTHISENEIDSIKADYTISNNTDYITDLQKEVREAIQLLNF